MIDTLCEAALDVLNSASAREKCEKTRRYAALWREGAIDKVGSAPSIPDRPARPDAPQLLHASKMPKRGKAGTQKNKIALLHALAHIELNAIDLAWDVMARPFPGCRPVTPLSFRTAQPEESKATEGDSSVATLTRNDSLYELPKAFYDDWVKVADDEAKHHMLLEERLNDLGASYGDLPAHDGLWEASSATANDFPARLAIVPMVLEARGLDVTPGMIETMLSQGDQRTADILKVIHDDEITHVRAGTVWFEGWCAFHDKDVESFWQDLVRKYFNGPLKKPFNHPSREEAGMIRDWYEPLAENLKEA